MINIARAQMIAVLAIGGLLGYAAAAGNGSSLLGADEERAAAPGNGQPFGGIKVTTGEGWFAARPSGTEDVYKIYAESLRSEDHLRRIQEEAREIVGKMLANA